MPSTMVWSRCRSTALITTLGLCLLPLSVLAQSGTRAGGPGKTPGSEAGHAAQLRRYAVFDPTLTCEQADRITHRALQHLGFKITPAAPTPAAEVKVIKGVREGHLDQENVTVKITCGADGVHVDSDTDLPPCEQANRVSYRAVERQGFTVTSFAPAADGGSGMVKGVREGPEGQESVALTITCGADAVFIDTSSEDNPLLASEDFYLAIGHFRRGFYALFNGIMTEELRREHIPESLPQDQMQVIVRPVVESEAQFEFGTEVTQVFPVRIEISNTTKRTYLLEAERIVLLTPSGERIKPFLPSQSELSARALASQTLAPGANVKGYLYYPPGSYTGARGFVVEQGSEEREGFAIQF